MVTAILRRHFFNVSNVRRVGDLHSDAYALLFATETADGKPKKYFGRLAPTARLECTASEELLQYLAPTKLLVQAPRHFLAEENLVIREYIEGHTLSQIDRYYVSSIEIILLFQKTATLPLLILNQIESVIVGDRLAPHAFSQRLMRILSRWPQFLKWRDSIGSFLSVPLPGEALRSPFRLMYNIHSSPLRSLIPFSLNRSTFCKSFSAYVCRLANIADIGSFAEKLKSQIDIVVRATRHCQLYDIHHDNLVLAEDGRVYIIDLECAGLGASDRLLSNQPFFVEDLKAVSRLHSIGKTAWSYKSNNQGTGAPIVQRPVAALRGTTRAILCGTESYEAIINTLRETLFICTAMKAHHSFEIDEHDEDIKSYGPFWRDFQKLKRWARGLGNPPSNVASTTLGELLAFCFEGKIVDSNALVDDARRSLTKLQRFPIDPDTIEYCIFMRVFEFLRFLPFEIVLDCKVSQRQIDASILRIASGCRSTALDGYLGATLDQIFRMEVPYHTLTLNGTYSFPPGLRRRIERKISITEKRESRRTRDWLTKALTAARAAS